MRCFKILRRFGGAALLSFLLILPTGCAGKEGRAAPETKLDGFLLTVLHTNDTHSAYGGTNAQGMPCYAAACDGGQGGRVRLERAAKAVRRTNPEAIFLDAGDVFQGSLYWTIHKESLPMALLDRMGYQAIIPGNHEFDDGCEPFLNLARALETPVIAANLSFKPPLKGGSPVKPEVVIERGGRKIGIVGLANPETPSISSPCPEARFADETKTLKAAVKKLSAQGVDIIIALTHLGLENDKRLARSVSGVDIIVGGHSHSLLSNTLAKAEGPYPVVEQSPEGLPVLIVTASSGANYLGRLEARFNGAGVPISWQGEPIALTDANLKAMKAPAADPALARLVEEYSEPARKMMREPLGRIEAGGRPGHPLEAAGAGQCRAEECLTGDIVADAFLTQPFSGAQVALINGGGLRNSLPDGPVSVGDVLVTLPFQNTPMLADMPGAVILEALEHGVSAYGEGAGAFLQVAGLRYAFDPKKEPGRRVIKAEVRDSQGQWREIDKKAAYKVVTINYLVKGGDGYAMLAPFKWRESKMLDNDVLRLHLEKNSPLAAKLEGRIAVER